ncbi:unnamed protein product [Rotaria magnacalcarata]|uniref:G-protein coupled receptors family 1 profile domain-containing protein n=1 Tax=Rotaria magnacalcarata TaxID=392030 RepID=A0A816MR74_9BILA|nr:unnamed protein product [Rotaria magnacalcarata]CAF4145842.1 unnamed protein product [Rotaria magnacalcarata]
MLSISCTFIGICVFILGSTGNGLCILVFLRKQFRYRIITPYFIVLLFADSIYLLFRLLKLPYYSQTLFKLPRNTEESCSKTFLARVFEHATQTWPEPFVPLVHSETYMRFSLILMSIMSVQRTTFITRSLKFLVLPSTFKDKHKYKSTLLLIVSAFLFAYIFEFAGLTLFCSKSNNRNITYDWFIYMNKYMENTTYILTNTISDEPKALRCVNYAINNFQENKTPLIGKNPVCTQDQLIDILTYYFDQHQKPIVNLIQKIILNQTGHRMSRNEIRRKYHFHECIFRQQANFFHRYYDFMYNRMFAFNRHTLLLVFGSIIPSLITIGSSIISVCRLRELNRLTSIYILPCRRRTDDTRRILLVITVECLLSILNSWFSNIVLSLVYCQRNLLAGDDCPAYLHQNYDLLVMFDMFNSVSNIILHCLCGKRFRNELRRMLKSFLNLSKQCFHHIWCCYFQIDCRKLRNEQNIAFNATIAQHDSSNRSGTASHNHVYLQIQTSRTPSRRNCCDFRWYFNRRPLVPTQECLSTISKNCLPKNETSYAVRYRSLTQRTNITKQSQVRSMRLYYPSQQNNNIVIK